ncbi:hypothetical protein Cantr_05867 [Candida viswanathii]|uniref:Uncharacterized protein n=1 Tax=Candida viswanathii TaxID=5486 RepID=A0A367XR32_9ASCO|nr:hypothetical protein Cantr_05867 [Candida viswanathii]
MSTPAATPVRQTCSTSKYPMPLPQTTLPILENHHRLRTRTTKKFGSTSSTQVCPSATACTSSTPASSSTSCSISTTTPNPDSTKTTPTSCFHTCMTCPPRANRQLCRELQQHERDVACRRPYELEQLDVHQER